MGQFYIAGENKKRPGSYQRYVNRGKNAGVGATDNSVAIPIQSDWGPVDVVTVHESVSSIITTYGNKGTVDAALALFEGGASKVYCIRLNKATNGEGASAAKSTLKLPSSGDGVVTITAKYPGTKVIKVQTRVKVENVSKEIIVYDGDTRVESFFFNSGDNEVANLINAVSASSYITAEAVEGAASKTVPVADVTPLTGGTDPAVTTESYSEAFNKLEPHQFTHIVLDCTTPAVQTVLTRWLDRVYEEGKLCVAVLGGQNKDVDMATLTAAAIGFDNMKVIYSGIWGRDEYGNVVDGYKMAALVAGAIADTPSNQSIVHLTVPGISAIEPHTNAEYETAIASGLLLASYSATGTVWFDSGVNTLINLSAEQDEGWRKIRRVATRFEMFTRVDNAMAPLVGRVNCDNDGIALAIQAGQGELNAMVSEGKLKTGATIYEDPTNLHNGDSAWFIIVADDNDGLEKIYTKYELRFSSNS